MNPHLTGELARQHQAGLNALGENRGPAAAARQARRAHRAQAHHGHRHALRRRTGWALVSLGARLAYGVGEE